MRTLKLVNRKYRTDCDYDQEVGLVWGAYERTKIDCGDMRLIRARVTGISIT